MVAYATGITVLCMAITIFNIHHPQTQSNQKFRLLFVVPVCNFALYSRLTDWLKCYAYPVTGARVNYRICVRSRHSPSAASPFIWIIYLDARNRKKSQDTRQHMQTRHRIYIYIYLFYECHFSFSFVRFELQSPSWYMRIFFMYFLFFFFFWYLLQDFYHFARSTRGELMEIWFRSWDA